MALSFPNRSVNVFLGWYIYCSVGFGFLFDLELDGALVLADKGSFFEAEVANELDTPN